MTVAELIANLETLDPEFEVYVSSDEEGNDYHLLMDIEPNMQAVVFYPGGASFDEIEIGIGLGNE
jgi:hypothetical protein